MDSKIDEITGILMQQIERYELEIEIESKGIVTYVGDGIARVQLEHVMAGELLEFPGAVYGMALNLEQDSVGAVILGPYLHIKEGDEVKRTSRIMEVPGGDALIGRVVNPVGVPLDGKGPIHTDTFRPAEFSAPGVIILLNWEASSITSTTLAASLTKGTRLTSISSESYWLAAALTTNSAVSPMESEIM